MNYFQAYLPSLDEAIVAAWDSQIADVADIPSLAQVLATKSAELLPRFADAYAQLRNLPRGTRRALQRQLARSCDVAIPIDWRQKLAGSLAGAALLLALGQGTAQANDITVNTTKPAINGADNKCSLIEAIINANDDALTHADCLVPGSGADRILLPAKKTITITTSNNYSYGSDTGLPPIISEITIEGNRGKIVRKGNALDFRLFAVSGTGELILKKLTLSGGRSAGSGGAIFAADTATVEIEDSTVSGNSAAADGGGIYSGQNATVTITDSTISSNSAGEDGGGIYSNYYSSLTIDNSRILKNKADYGGGIFGHDNGVVTITRSTVSGNSAGTRGGGIFNDANGTVTITDSTISGNRSDGGGGIFNNFSGQLTIANSTISGNTANVGGGFHNNYYYDANTLMGYFGTVRVNNSTIAGNRGYAAGGGGLNRAFLYLKRTLISGNQTTIAANGAELNNDNTGHLYAADYNLFGFSGNAGIVGASPGATDIVPAEPLGKIVGPLKNNGGPTKTRALPNNSPAKDAAPVDADCPATDQRGTSRPQGSLCDIGAFEK